MKRGWNIPIWVGFLLVFFGFFTYLPVFARFPATRDFPWVNLLMFGVGLILMASGLTRAYREPQLYRGRIVGSILVTLGFALFALFGLGIFYFARQLPASGGAPQIGQKAPDFTLPDKDGNPITLSKLLDAGPSGAGRVNGVVLIFYRGYW